MKEVVLDTETTGISVKEGHRLVEIGCIELENLIPTKNRFHCYLNPERKVSEKALEVHGYTDEFLGTQKKFLEVVDKFLEFIKDKRLIIHNAEFDLSHLNNELAILGKKKINNEIVDTLVLARDKFPGSPVSLDALCKRYRVDNSRRTQHTALIDCDLLAKVYINLIDQKEPSLNFESDEIKTNLKSNESKDYFKKVVLPSAEELKKHKEYLKNNLKKNFKSQYQNGLKQIEKKQLMDALDKEHSFDLPQGILDQEFNDIWHRIEHAKKDGTLDEDDKKLSDDQLKKRYQEISQRRVKLAMLLQYIAKENKITVDEKELSQGMMQYATQYPGQEKEIIEYFKKNPSSIETIRGPILEEKVIKHITSECDLIKTKLNKNEYEKLEKEVFEVKKDK